MFDSPPTSKHLSRLYFELSEIGAKAVGKKEVWSYGNLKSKEELLSLACDMSRNDPRLLEIMVCYFIDHWREVDPLKLRLQYPKMRCRQTVAVVLEFARSVIDDVEFSFFADYLIRDITPSPTQFYFYGIYSPGGALARRATEEPLSEFKRWGFLASERPVIDQAEKRMAGTLDNFARRNVLRRILTEKVVISLGDYLKSLNHSVSRQQALTDIKSSKMAIAEGKGRGAKWKIAI